MKATAMLISLLISLTSIGQMSFNISSGVGTKIREEESSPLMVTSIFAAYQKSFFEFSGGYYIRSNVTRGTGAGFIAAGLYRWGFSASFGVAYGGGQIKDDRHILPNGDTLWLTHGEKSANFKSFFYQVKYVLNDKKWDLSPFTSVSWLNQDYLFNVGVKYKL